MAQGSRLKHASFWCHFAKSSSLHSHRSCFPRSHPCLIALLFHLRTVHLPYFFRGTGVSTATRTLVDSLAELPNQVPSQTQKEIDQHELTHHFFGIGARSVSLAGARRCRTRRPRVRRSCPRCTSTSCSSVQRTLPCTRCRAWWSVRWFPR